MTKIKICLDAGHYGKYNRSPAVPTYYESDMNWKLHLLLKKYLETYGVEVILTRGKQATDLGLTARGRKSAGCDLFLSIHSNAVGSYVKEATDFPVVFVPLNGSGTELGKKLAKCIETTMGTEQAGEVYTKRGNNGDYYGVIRGATSVGVPGLILEHSFHTCTRSTLWLLDERNLDKMARAEAEVIAEHFGLVKVDKETEKEECTVKLHVLRKGDKGEDVRALQILLIGNGFSCGDSGVDGSFGPATLKAVKAYQKDKGLQQDGVAGPATLSSLLGV